MNSYSISTFPKGLKLSCVEKRKDVLIMLKIIVERKTMESYKETLRSIATDIGENKNINWDEQIPEVNKKGYRLTNTDGNLELTIKDGYIEKALELYAEYIPTIISAAKSLASLLEKFGARFDKLVRVFDEDVKEETKEDQEAK